MRLSSYYQARERHYCGYSARKRQLECAWGRTLCRKPGANHCLLPYARGKRIRYYLPMREPCDSKAHYVLDVHMSNNVLVVRAQGVRAIVDPTDVLRSIIARNEEDKDVTYG